MHEAGLMQTAIDLAAVTAWQQGATCIHRICLRVGDLSGVEPDALSFAFEVLRADTIASAAVLEIVAAPGQELDLVSVEVSGP